LIENNWITLVKPNKVDYKISDNKKFGTVVIEPLEKGFGTTLGNALREFFYHLFKAQRLLQLKLTVYYMSFQPLRASEKM